MTHEEHRTNLGGLLSNLQSLEFIIRAFLQKHTTPKPPDTVPYGTSFYTSPVGTELPENEITNYDSLGLLIDKFNAIAKIKGLKELDKSIVELRDVLAHGRVSALTADEHMHLIKFSKPISNKVKIVYNQEMTEQWFKINTRRVYDAIEFVNANY